MLLIIKILLFITWIMLAAFGLYLWFVDDVRFNKRVFPWFIPLPYLVLLLLAVLHDPPVKVLAFIVVAVLFSVYTQIRFIRFCDCCGGTVYNGWLWFRRMKSCYHCGAKIDNL